MSVNVKVEHHIFCVSNDALEKAIIDLTDKRERLEEVKRYLIKNKVTTPLTEEKKISLGYFDFNELLESRGPSIVGTYYQLNTSYGRKNYGKRDITKIRF